MDLPRPDVFFFSSVRTISCFFMFMFCCSLLRIVLGRLLGLYTTRVFSRSSESKFVGAGLPRGRSRQVAKSRPEVLGALAMIDDGELDRPSLDSADPHAAGIASVA